MDKQIIQKKTKKNWRFAYDMYCKELMQPAPANQTFQ